MSLEYTAAYLSQHLPQVEALPLTLCEGIRVLADVACLLPAVRKPFRQARRGSAGGTPKVGHILTSPDVCIL